MAIKGVFIFFGLLMIATTIWGVVSLISAGYEYDVGLVGFFGTMACIALLDVIRTS